MSDGDGFTPLYHGTRRPFRRGGLVLPRSEHGGAANHETGPNGVPFAEDADRWVYLTPDLDLAWAYAEAAAGRGRPKVVEVAPWGELFVDDSTVNGEDEVQFRCEAATVLRVHTVREDVPV